MKAAIAPVLAMLVLLHAGADMAEAGGYFIVEGVGVERGIEIGGVAPSAGAPDAQGWHRAGNSPLFFKQTSNSRVALIRCDNYCVTNRGISVNATRQDVMDRYGRPVNIRRVNNNDFLVYRGIGFEVERGTVRSIYVFPVAAQAR